MRAADILAIALGMLLCALAEALDERHNAARRQMRALLARVNSKTTEGTS
jgi:hypothetical protein